MKLDLQGLAVLVTGSSRGIGFETARQMGQGGANVTICARNRDDLDRAAGRLEGVGVSCQALAADLTEADSARAIVEAAVGRWGRLDVLVNNVGGLPSTGRFEELTDEQWMKTFDLNAMTTVRFCRQAIPHLRKSGRGRIINITSAVAEQPGTFNPHYSAAKAFVWNLSRHLATTLAADGVLVNCIAPGIIGTESWSDYIAAKASAESLPLEECRANEHARAAAGVPLGRLGEASEVAFMATVLASSQASFMTGGNYRVDGGKVRSL